MGKIRVKTFGDEEIEKKQEKKLKTRKAAKKIEETQKQVETKNLSGSEIQSNVIPSVAKQFNPDVISNDNEKSQGDLSLGLGDDKSVEKKKAKKKSTKHRARSKSYQAAAIRVDKAKTYPLNEALGILPKLKRAKFDETVELHINTVTPGISVNITLPHGTGKKTRVAIADDAIIAQVAKGEIEFDLLLAEPSMMPKIAKVAKFLGPRGLMPNPKNGTITANPKETAKKYEGGLMNIKTESKSPVMHVSVGKVSFGEKKLEENIQTVLNAVNASKIEKIVLKSTMSPGIKVQV